jgi:hypothetical protein
MEFDKEQLITNGNEAERETKVGGKNELIDPSALIKGCHRIPSVALKVYLVPSSESHSAVAT